MDTGSGRGAPWEGEEKLVPGEKPRSASGCPFAGTKQATNKCLLNCSEFPEHGDIQRLSPILGELPCELTH